MADTVELKAIVSSDAGAAKTDIKDLGTAVQTTGEQAKTAGSKFGEFGDRIGKMNPKELAGQIMSITNSLSNVGDMLDAVAANDVKKFESSMNSAMQGVVGAVSLIAPQFAPILAILSPIIVKTASWALGMEDAAEAAKKLEQALKDQIKQIERQHELASIRATNREEELKADLEEVDRKIALQQKLRDEEMTGLSRQKELIKIRDAMKELEWERTKIFEEQKAQAREDREEREKTADQAADQRAEKRAEDEQKRHDDEIDRIDKIVQTTEEGILLRNEAEEGFHDEVARRHANMMKALDEEHKKKVATDKAIADSAKKSAADQAKAQEDLARKIQSTTNEIVGILATGFKDRKAMAEQFRDFMLKLIVDHLTKELAATLAHKAAVTAVDATHTASSSAFAGARAAAELATVPPKVVSAYAPFPFIGVGLAAAAIAAFFALAKPKFEEGGPVSGRVPGLGSQDRTSIDAGADEGVLTGAGMNTPLGAILGLINKGLGNNGTALAAAGPAQQLDVRVSFDVPGGSDDSFVRWVMERINVRVVQRNAPLVASRYHSQNGRAI